MRIHTKRRGFSLLEVLCVMAVLAVLGLVMAGLLKYTFDVERAQARGFDQLVHTSALADQFRTDVAQAEETPEIWELHVANASTLILKLKSGDHIVYGWDKGKLTREGTVNNKAIRRQLPLDAGRASVEFVRGGAVIRMRLRTRRDGKDISGQTLEITAALGGDLR